jgi:hypothetical protein
LYSTIVGAVTGTAVRPAPAAVMKARMRIGVSSRVSYSGRRERAAGFRNDTR